MNKKNIKRMLEILDNTYGGERCYLNYETPEQLLIATILSAQCTDERVNKVTESLFKKYKSLSDYLSVPLEEFEEDIKTCGFYKVKARHIVDTARILLEEYDGVVPSEMELLTKLPGVGRKTANIIRGHIFQIPSIAVDTHVKRLSKRLGLTENTDPDKIEMDLISKIPKQHMIRLNTQLIAHGRAVCTAKKTHCEECVLAEVCKKAI